jgi:hypothetical protein
MRFINGTDFIEICKENKTTIFVFKFELSRNISWKDSIETTLVGARAFLKTSPADFCSTWKTQSHSTLHVSWRLEQKYKLRRPGYLAVVEIGSTPCTLLLKVHQQNVQVHNVQLRNVYFTKRPFTEPPGYKMSRWPKNHFKIWVVL